MFNLFKNKKKRDEELLKERIAAFFYVFYKHKLQMSKEDNIDDSNTDNVITVVDFITETCLTAAGYTPYKLDEDKAMMVMVITFVISDSICHYIPLINKNGNSSAELISSVVSNAMFMRNFQLRVGNIYTEAMNVYNTAQETNQNWIKVLQIIARYTMDFFESGANEEKLLPIVKSMDLLLKNAELKEPSD